MLFCPFVRPHAGWPARSLPIWQMHLLSPKRRRKSNSKAGSIWPKQLLSFIRRTSGPGLELYSQIHNSCLKRSLTIHLIPRGWAAVLTLWKDWQDKTFCFLSIHLYIYAASSHFYLTNTWNIKYFIRCLQFLEARWLINVCLGRLIYYIVFQLAFRTGINPRFLMIC